ncbi:MAG: 3-deoxy-D-manno-octulosonic acid transferase [Bacteroidetes bacterium]|nr:3-deoxy-D-manno-octulosonic acid transferase [Bacteroidota bacterium]MCL1968110.1 3-deoxy-D-manno-octulosonic acid transferase [Bacteroidota bacterium]
MRVFYSLFITIHTCLIKSASLFFKKAKLWSNGRKKLWISLEEKCQGRNDIIWFHCASLGEFEQGKPLMEKIKQDKNVSLLVTFFSPSGFEVKKDDPLADIVTYLPVDTPQNAKKFISIVKPQKVFFIKYEIWYNYIMELSKAGIPFYYVSSIFRENQYFFKGYGKWFLKQLKKCNCFFVQNENSGKILRKHGISNVVVAGDTRFDRVYAIAQYPFELEFIPLFKKEKKILVAGSTWMPDEKLLAQLFQKISTQYKLIIAPHEVEKNHIEQIKKLFHSFSVVCYSEKETKDISNAEILIIDSIGLLSKIYKYADISYIGGAFKTGLHNILEAVVFEKPIFFGPEYRKFNEAVELVNHGAAFSITCANEMAQQLLFFENNPSSYQTTCDICKNYIAQNLGATDKILKYIIMVSD